MIDSINEALEHLKISYKAEEPFEGIEISMGEELLFLEKLPEKPVLSLSAQFCRYYELKDIKKDFEIFLNSHIHGILTLGAFFSADSSSELVILNKLLPANSISGEELAGEIAIFAEVLKTLRDAWKKGELDSLAATVKEKAASLNETSIKI